MSMFQNAAETAAQADKRTLSQVLLEWASDAHARDDRVDCERAITTLYAFYDAHMQAPQD